MRLHATVYRSICSSPPHGVVSDRHSCAHTDGNRRIHAIGALALDFGVQRDLASRPSPAAHNPSIDPLPQAIHQRKTLWNHRECRRKDRGSMHPQCRRLADIPAADTPAAGTPADAPVMDIPAAGSLAADTPLPDTPAAGTPVATGSTLAADSPAGNLAENTTGPDTELHRPQEPSRPPNQHAGSKRA